MIKYLFIFILFFPLHSVQAHCQIPCGIYDDARQFDELEEHITTIEKSMKSILASYNAHDIIRWTINKEEHAQKIQDIISAYFLTQRLTQNRENYTVHLALLHQILIHAMKAKQTTDLSHVNALQKDIKSYEKLYFSPQEHRN